MMILQMSDNNNQHTSNINMNKLYASITFINSLIFKIINIFHKFNINEIHFSMKRNNHTKNIPTKLKGKIKIQNDYNLVFEINCGH